MLFGFSSIGKPEAGLAETLSLAKAYKLDFVELRSLGGTIDLPAYFEKGPVETWPKEKPAVRLLGTSLRLTDSDDEAFRQLVRYGELAKNLDAPYLRVFGGGHPDDLPSPADYARAAAAVCRARQDLRQRGLKAELLLETHDAFSSSKACAALNSRLEEPLGILWDSHHTWKLAGEAPKEVWSRLGAFVRHVHYKDSVSRSAAKYDYVPPGEGEFPTRELLELLRGGCFAEGFSLEWEKLWHPDLPELEAVLDHFASIIIPYAS